MAEGREMSWRLLGGFSLWLVVVDLKITSGRRKLVDSGQEWKWHWKEGVVLVLKCAASEGSSHPSWVWREVESGSAQGVDTHRSLGRRVFPLPKETVRGKVPC